MLTAMTMNLRMDTDHDGDNAWSYRMDAVVEEIRRSGADIVGTQEGLPHMLWDLDAKLL